MLTRDVVTYQWPLEMSTAYRKLRAEGGQPWAAFHVSWPISSWFLGIPWGHSTELVLEGDIQLPTKNYQQRNAAASKDEVGSG